MAYKDPERRREAIREHYYKNKARYLDKNRRRRIEIRQKIYAMKESAPCFDCKVKYPYYVMDFDHLEDKQGLVSKLMNANNVSALMKEIAKCEIVCSNCHRIRTYKRLQENQNIL